MGPNPILNIRPNLLLHLQEFLLRRYCPNKISLKYLGPLDYPDLIDIFDSFFHMRNQSEQI